MLGIQRDRRMKALKALFSQFDYTHANILCAVVVTLFTFFQLRGLFSNRRARVGAKHENTEKHHWTVDKVDKRVGEDESCDPSCESFLAEEQVRYHPLDLTEEESMLRSQLFYEKMKLRRSVRTFSSRAVPVKLVQNLIKTAGTAPSGANLQPWMFCVVGNSTAKQRIRDIIEGEEQINYSRRMGAKWVLDVSKLDVNWCKPYLTEAPFLIIVMKQVYQISENGERQPTYYSEISASIAVGILLAAIQNVGLVTVTTTPLNAGSKIRELLRRPLNEKVLVVLPIGYPADGATVPNLKRKSLEQIIKLY